MSTRRRLACAIALVSLAAGFGPAAGASENGEHELDDPRGLYLGSQRNWMFWSFLPEGDEAETLGLEFESYWETKRYSFKNISYFEIADYPRPIPGQPPGTPSPGDEVKAGINDLLTAAWISKRGGHHGKHHLAWGAAAQLPTATVDSMGSGQWSLGPSFDYEYSSGKLFAGVIGLQLWSVAGDSDRKSVNYFMAKPFVVYSFHERWDALYMPYGISIYWDKPSGEDVYLPLGGGVQYHASESINLSLQFFENVLRPTKGTEYDLRFMLEFVLD